MALSMTGFGSATLSLNQAALKCEVQTLNKKNFEPFFILPKFCLFAELELKKVAEKMLQRGKVTVLFDVQSLASKKRISLNETLAESWRKAIAVFEKKYGYKNNLMISDWLRLNEIWEVQEEKVNPGELYKKLEACMVSAIKQVLDMRKKEGERLQKDILTGLSKTQNLVASVTKRAPLILREYQKKIQHKIRSGKEFSPQETDLFNRFISAFADKADIHEEIVRLNSHFHQFRDLLKKETPVGRTLDFLLQECNREINTIGSKASDVVITQNVINIKTLLEQIREQIQNIL
jgi:uncharacterized protein (TIGR00255 family)